MMFELLIYLWIFFIAICSITLVFGILSWIFNKYTTEISIKLIFFAIIGFIINIYIYNTYFW